MLINIRLYTLSDNGYLVLSVTSNIVISALKLKSNSKIFTYLEIYYIYYKLIGSNFIDDKFNEIPNGY